ncbi:hypothetical protein SH16_01751 [Aeromonas caviae]|uniref:HEPN/Toprim-associated domain-containing protein n=1 Tax=Aeromonas caviae TaxID=648 RepID=UPI00065043F0|nr:HEPN/Toprim-associated domain-containing protein [Aeromonas caviae]KLV46266.1 hypothetical protein SH16_01751 [Aeromonas caviae]MEE1913346.1 HEPN/Toprim-associated domain-containing protein [Aeromonas caviae]
MGSFAEIRINGIELESWKNTYYEWYFTRSDRVREIYSIIEDHDHDKESFIGYRASVETIKRRLQLDGYDLASAKKDFERTRSIWVKEMIDSLEFYNLEQERGVNYYTRTMDVNLFFIENISLQLEVVKNTKFEDWCNKVIEANSRKYDYYDKKIRMEPVNIDNDPLLSLMLSELFGVNDESLGVGGSIFPCMQIESLAVVLLCQCKDDDVCELDITDLVNGGWVNDFEDIEQIQDGETRFYENFVLSINELIVLNRQKENQVLQRMIFSSVITAMEAYLSDTMKKNVLNRHAIKRRFVEIHKPFVEKNMKEARVFEFLDNLDKRINEEIDKISFHNIGTVKDLYRDVLLCQLPEAEISALIKSVETRHDIVHRNGKSIAGEMVIVTKKDVRELIKLVRRVVVSIDKQILDGLLDTGS